MAEDSSARRMKTFTHAMIEGYRVDDHESIKVVLVRYIIAVPPDHVEGTVILIGHKQLSLILAHDLVIGLVILVPGHRRLKVSRIRQAVRSCVSVLVNRPLGKR